MRGGRGSPLLRVIRAVPRLLPGVHPRQQGLQEDDQRVGVVEVLVGEADRVPGHLDPAALREGRVELVHDLRRHLQPAADPGLHLLRGDAVNGVREVADMEVPVGVLLRGGEDFAPHTRPVLRGGALWVPFLVGNVGGCLGGIPEQPQRLGGLPYKVLPLHEDADEVRERGGAAITRALEESTLQDALPPRVPADPLLLEAAQHLHDDKRMEQHRLHELLHRGGALGGLAGAVLAQPKGREGR
mmetsp:Transcript_12069/g.28615  ORF Transcript_12069/g.28615 Transcript_12069/m.28615 type:complete len:243 (-) Transcript_12069:1060-1788(-)